MLTLDPHHNHFKGGALVSDWAMGSTGLILHGVEGPVGTLGPSFYMTFAPSLDVSTQCSYNLEDTVTRHHQRAETRPLPDTQPVGTLVLDLPPPELREIHLYVQINHPA